MLLAMAATSPCLSSQRGAGNQKVIKDPAEYRAYITALNTKDPAQKGAAMEAFVRAYPDSVVKIDALEHAMAAYQQAGNTAKVGEIAKRILDLHPHNVRALAVLTYILRSGNDATQACPFAQNGLQTLSAAEQSESLSEADFRKFRAQMAEIFYGALGACALEKKDYGTATNYYLRALQINPNNLQNVYQLAIADLETNPIEVNGLWYIARAVNLAKIQGNPQAGEDMETYGKEKYRKYHGGEDGWDQLVAKAAKETSPPTDGSRLGVTPTPAALAVTAVQQHDPATLSFSDWEFILQYRDSSPANKDAADKVWRALQDKQQGGKTKLKIPVKVISANRDMIQGAITEENQQANKADLQVIMQKPLTHPLTAGSMIDVIGVMTSYTPQPFMFIMANGELFGAKPDIKTQLSAADIERLLEGGVTPRRATELVKQKGVDFTLDGPTETRLRKAGATDELLLATATSKK